MNAIRVIHEGYPFIDPTGRGRHLAIEADDRVGPERHVMALITTGYRRGDYYLVTLVDGKPKNGTQIETANVVSAWELHKEGVASAIRRLNEGE
jgi:hypothetical protein